MMKLLIPIILLILGVGGGVGAGIMLAPAPEEAPAEGEETETDGEEGEETSEEGAEDSAEGEEETAEEEDSETGPVEFLNMTNQFVIPLVDGGEVNGLVVATIALEVVEGTIGTVHGLEPKIRDRFLQVLFNHANNGGFDGNFTDFRYIKSLKEELLRNAQVVAGKDVTDVLLLDLIRQVQ